MGRVGREDTGIVRVTMAQTILLVDDDPAVVRMLKRGLVGAGFDVETAAGGADALERLDQRTYDLLLTDVSMPEVDGLMVLDHAVRNARAKATIGLRNLVYNFDRYARLVAA